MHYGEIKNCDIANGLGVRVTLFVSGCTNHCENCFQPQTWDFCYGKPFTSETEDELIRLLSPDYVEVPNMQQNLEAVLQVMKFIYDNIIYAELNTKSDYCQVCGWDGEIDIVEEGGKLIWRCPKCGNTDQDKMNVARRTCGYIGTQFWNQGRTQEIKERVLHL